MKEYKKAKMIAKNLPTGSYAAGCPSQDSGSASCSFFVAQPRWSCKGCERTQ